MSAGAGGAGAGDRDPDTRPVVLYDANFPPSLQRLLEKEVEACGCCLSRGFDVIHSAAREAASIRSRVVALVTHLHPAIGATQFKPLPALRVVSNYGVGTDHINAVEATAAGVSVGNTPGAMATTTADMGFALLLAAARNVIQGHAICSGPGGAPWDPNWFGVEVTGACIGIVGMGRIGLEVAKRARGFDMSVLYHNRRPVPADKAAAAGDAEYCATLSDLLPRADFVVLCCPCNEETRHMISKPQLAQMRGDAVLVNIGRGALVNQDDVIQALRDRTIRTYATDGACVGQLHVRSPAAWLTWCVAAALCTTVYTVVFDAEPLPDDHPLRSCPHVVMTPHTGSATLAARSRMMKMVCANLRAGLAGNALPTGVNTIPRDVREAKIAALLASDS